MTLAAHLGGLELLGRRGELDASALNEKRGLPLIRDEVVHDRAAPVPLLATAIAWKTFVRKMKYDAVTPRNASVRIDRLAT